MPSAFYVDLSAVGTGSGTSASPWNWLQFYTDVSAATPVLISAYDDVYLRGGVDITNSPSGTKEFIGDNYFNMLSWSLSDYGPWRIYDSTNRIHLNKVYSMEGGIIITDCNVPWEYPANEGGTLNGNRPGISLYAKQIDTCFIKSQLISIRNIELSNFPADAVENHTFDGTAVIYCTRAYSATSADEININGSTLVCSGTYPYVNIDVKRDTIINVKDCVVNISNFKYLIYDQESRSIPYSAASINNDWVVTSSSDITAFSGTSAAFGWVGSLINFSATDMQYGWEPSVSWPSYSADMEEWEFSALGGGITLTGSGEW